MKEYVMSRDKGYRTLSGRESELSARMEREELGLRDFGKFSRENERISGEGGRFMGSVSSRSSVKGMSLGDSCVDVEAGVGDYDYIDKLDGKGLYLDGEYELRGEELKRFFPKCYHSLFRDEERMRDLNKALYNPDFGDGLRQRFVDHSNVLSTGKYKLGDYIRAVKYVSYVEMGYSNVDSWCLSNPGRHREILDIHGGIENESCKKKLRSCANSYSRGTLVKAIMSQVYVDSWVLNSPLRQEALNVLAKVIRDDKTKGMTKVRACEAILGATKEPESVQHRVSIDLGGSDLLEDLRDSVREIAEEQRKKLEEGVIDLGSYNSIELGVKE